LLAIELGRTGDLTGTDAIIWQVGTGTPYVPSPLLYGDKIYVCKSNSAEISCYQAETGKPNFVEQQLEGLDEVYASPVGAADHVYFVDRDGKTAVIKRSDKLEVVAVNSLDDKIDASPAIVGDELFLKGATYLYCIAGS
jgi:outer membrane protein assembly factor BamB